MSDVVRQQLETTIRSEFSAKHAGILIAFENTKYHQPKGEPWIHVAIVPGDIHRKEVSSSRIFCDYGVVNIACMVPEDQGTKLLQQMSWTLSNILFDRNWSLGASGRLTTFGVKRRNRGQINGFHTFNVLCEYEHTGQFAATD
jgi:hypothetical protein